MKENENETEEIYTLSPEDLLHVANTLTKLNDLQKDVMLDLPSRIVVRSYEEWAAIGYVIHIDDGWFFEAITVKEQEKIGRL
jgi:hypothetical protein